MLCGLFIILATPVRHDMGVDVSVGVGVGSITDLVDLPWIF